MYDVIVSNDVYKDTLIDQWMCSNVILKSSHHVMKDIIMTPTVDIELLTYRQNAIYTPDISLQLKYLKELEPDVSYILSLDHTVDFICECRIISACKYPTSAVRKTSW